MASRGVAVLKFVGTVSLGLLTGLSFSLATVTVPTLLHLPSARTAAKAFRSLADAAAGPLRGLAGVASSAFFLAYLLSPRTVRHPYLLYTGLLVLGGRVATDDRLTPYLYSASSSASSSPAAAFPDAAPRDLRRSGTSPAHMEASYEVLGAGSDTHSDGTGSDDANDLDAASASATPAAAAGGAGGLGDNGACVNGEEVRAAVEVFLKKQLVRTVLSGLAFAMSVVGLWGDGARAVPVWETETFIVV
ncbi:hypothetical protein SPI_02459 [Niveomyces insectorum RCEF 264]|uniref:Autophagy-related protein 33 n=1 Tax=Niveomyces insectorum RCEF 264 TaxID=1081102 RepID=A0A162J9G8_9HYPO|nr:hypothetical protein SPI_02459 [Niveomyces insectorum RCEF 264]